MPRLPFSTHRTLVIALTSLVTLGAFLIIFQIWGLFIDPSVFFKLLVTIGILIVLAGFLLVVRSDFGDHKKLKDENYLD